MAVFVVGDVTVPHATEMIRKYFGNLKNPVNERPRTDYRIAPYADKKTMVITDFEASSYRFSLLFPARTTAKQQTWPTSVNSLSGTFSYKA